MSCNTFCTSEITTCTSSLQHTHARWFYKGGQQGAGTTWQVAVSCAHTPSQHAPIRTARLLDACPHCPVYTHTAAGHHESAHADGGPLRLPALLTCCACGCMRASCIRACVLRRRWIKVHHCLALIGIIRLGMCTPPAQDKYVIGTSSTCDLQLSASTQHGEAASTIIYCILPAMHLNIQMAPDLLHLLPSC